MNLKLLTLQLLFSVLVIFTLMPIFETYGQTDSQQTFVEKIAYEKNQSIYVINADGSGIPIKIADGFSPEISPDGTRIVYSDTNYDLTVIDLASFTERILVEDLYADYPTWSPDGTKIAYEGSDPCIDVLKCVNVIDADGTGEPVPITDVLSYHPSWSPDGTRIAFEGRCTTFATCIFIVKADGSGNPTQITNMPLMGDPAWNPTLVNGQEQIAASRGDEGTYGDIWLLTNHGGDWQSEPFITGESAVNSAWHPDGNLFAWNDEDSLQVILSSTDSIILPTGTDYPAKKPSWGLIPSSVLPLVSLQDEFQRDFGQHKLPFGTFEKRTGITASINQHKQLPGEEIPVNIQLSGKISNNNVGISLTDPGGNVIMNRVIPVSESGTAEFKFRLPEDSPAGGYKIILTHKSGDNTYKESINFNVVSIPQIVNSSNNVEIISVQSVDQQGNPVDSFNRGNTGYAKVIISGNMPSDVLTTVNLFSADSASIGLGSIRGQLEGESEVILSFYIPIETVTGKATMFANAYSDWPTNGGTPLTDEVSEEVIIE